MLDQFYREGVIGIGWPEIETCLSRQIWRRSKRLSRRIGAAM